MVKPDHIIGAMAIMMVIVMTFVVINVQKTIYNDAEEYCDNIFGENQWIFVAVESDERIPWYIGQQMKCVSNNTTTRE